MAVSIRLWRGGAKKRAHYRIVAADSRSPRDGRFVEILGHYHPLSDSAEFELNKEKIIAYYNDGATVSATVRSLLEKQGVQLPKRMSRCKKLRMKKAAKKRASKPKKAGKAKEKKAKKADKS